MAFEQLQDGKLQSFELVPATRRAIGRQVTSAEVKCARVRAVGQAQQVEEALIREAMHIRQIALVRLFTSRFLPPHPSGAADDPFGDRLVQRQDRIRGQIVGGVLLFLGEACADLLANTLGRLARTG